MTKHFKPEEFTCKCGKCDGGKVAPELIERLGRVREKLTKPIRITSGFRCKLHQESLRRSGHDTATGVSQHELGRAADIQCDQTHFQELCRLVQEEFQAVGIASNWLHVDLRSDKKRRWFY